MPAGIGGWDNGVHGGRNVVGEYLFDTLGTESEMKEIVANFLVQSWDETVRNWISRTVAKIYLSFYTIYFLHPCIAADA